MRFRAAPPRKFGGGESIMTTGEEYGRTHAMGIAMPGMGSAIPMPGLAKMGVRIPGFAHASSESREEADSASNTADDMTHVRQALSVSCINVSLEL